MRYNIHPVVKLVKDQIHLLGYGYQSISNLSGMSLQRLKNIMSGRSDMTLRELDIICAAINISPVEIMTGGIENQDREGIIDLRGLPVEIENCLKLLHREVCKLQEKIRS